MATIVNNPPPENSSMGLFGILGILLVVIILIYLGIVYILPGLQQTQSSGPQVNVPSKIDVNLNQEK